MYENKCNFIILSVLLSLYFSSITLGEGRYIIDSQHTLVSFIVRHLVISKVHGKFNEFSGIITYDENDIKKFSLQGRIKVSSIDTDNVKRDKHLRSDDFFSAESYPYINFVSTGVEKQEDAYVLIGNLTIKGITKKIAIPFSITGNIIDPVGQPRIGFEATLRINRQDFAVSYTRAMDNGGLVVGNTVNIKLVGEACQPSKLLKPEHRQNPLVCAN